MSYATDQFDIIEHYGVPGQKWGVRKDRPKGSSANINAISTKPLSKMTTAEINEVVNRYDAEKRYSRMLAETARNNRSTSAKLGEWAGKVIKDAVTETATKELKGLVKREIKNHLIPAITSRAGG